jgi:hypothetical protein
MLIIIKIFFHKKWLNKIKLSNFMNMKHFGKNLYFYNGSSMVRKYRDLLCLLLHFLSYSPFCLSIATAAHFWFLFERKISCSYFTFSLYASLLAKWVFCRKHIVECCILKRAFDIVEMKIIKRNKRTAMFLELWMLTVKPVFSIIEWFFL